MRFKNLWLIYMINYHLGDMQVKTSKNSHFDHKSMEGGVKKKFFLEKFLLDNKYKKGSNYHTP